MRPVTVAATQFACSWDLPANADRAEALIRQAAGQGAQAVLIQELFATPYFCITQRAEYLDLAQPMQGHPLIARFSALARELGVVLPLILLRTRRGRLFQQPRDDRCRRARAGQLPQDPYPAEPGL